MACTPSLRWGREEPDAEVCKKHTFRWWSKDGEEVHVDDTSRCEVSHCYGVVGQRCDVGGSSDATCAQYANCR